ncbi:hypothetical protein CBL_10344 [Carabus blaptoides fortunei]
MVNHGTQYFSFSGAILQTAVPSPLTKLKPAHHRVVMEGQRAKSSIQCFMIGTTMEIGEQITCKPDIALMNVRCTSLLQLIKYLVVVMVTSGMFAGRYLRL